MSPRRDAASITATRSQVLERIRNLPPSGRRTVLVAIDGRGGAGKSSLAAWLGAELSAEVLHTDDFAHVRATGWDWQPFRDELLIPLSDDRVGVYSPLDWETGEVRERRRVHPGGVVIVEGVSASRRELGDVWDLTVWVDCAADVRISRGLARDGEDALDSWMGWEAQEDRYVAAQHPHERADLVVDGMEPF